MIRISSDSGRLLARKVKEKRLLIAEAGAIPHLFRLFKSENAIAQEISVTAIFNLALHKKNRSRIMEGNDCLESIVSVIVSGLTTEARENAAAILFCLCTEDGYKKEIANTDGCIESLVSLLPNGTSRGKHDVMSVLYNISINPDNCSRMVNSGGVSALVGALANEVVAERAAEVLGVVAKQSLGAETIGREESAVERLVELMRCGTPKAKEHAVAALLQLCLCGGAVVVEKVARAPALELLAHKVWLTGTDRARRKAFSLVLVLDKCNNTAMMRSGNREGSFRNDVSVPISIPVSVCDLCGQFFFCWSFVDNICI